ncbi:MAG: dTDP-4-dehydrorhamnose reductase [Lactobacillaceae bacterium]|jgi:dTDP-4-dehydrorhamnose reductase|nr:dTDP-4-dehydrorhamnose reductase [Lactobacillaceae bacterium]
MILVTGANGQLGNELRLILKDKAVYVDVDELDITNAKAVAKFCDSKKFALIINCAAYTAVDRAEEEKELAELINVKGPKNLAQTGIALIHISTDYVFDGNNYKPYVETDITNPGSVYGRTKAQGEQTVLETAKTALIIRTSWLYSTFGNNFLKTMRRLGAEKESLNVVFDQTGTPTYARDLAQAIADIIPQMKIGTKAIYHYSNEGVCSWYDFATAIMGMSDLNCEVLPIESKDYLTLAKRPFYSVFNKAKIKKDFGIKIRHWADSLADCINNL